MLMGKVTSMIYAVAGLITNDILAMNTDPNTYPSPNDICDAKTAKHLPPLLFMFISWLLDKKHVHQQTHCLIDMTQ